MKFFRRVRLMVFVVACVCAGCVIAPPPPPPVTRRPAPPPPPSPAARPEMRGIWLRDPRGQDWDRVMRELRASGFNALFVNFATGGAAFYPSKIVPQISQRDNEMDLCLSAARRHGIAVHAKLICYFAYLSPPGFEKQILRDQRELREADGKPHRQAGNLWLDPAQEINRQHVVALAREILQRYEVDGLQLDYVRFPEMNQVARSGQAALIDDTVSRVRTEMRRTRPVKPLSAAVFYSIERARTQMGQDWPSWARRGLVDFLCPMNYTTDNTRYSAWLRAQQAEIRGAVPLHTGVGAYMFSDSDHLATQIDLARRLEPSGFVVFAYTEEFGKSVLPKLRFVDARNR